MALITLMEYLRYNLLVEEGVLVVVDELSGGHVNGAVRELCQGRDARPLLFKGHLPRHLLHQLLRQSSLADDVLSGVHFPAKQGLSLQQN